ncbi:hypothetical protein, partial [Arthrobacter sp. ES1]
MTDQDGPMANRRTAEGAEPVPLPLSFAARISHGDVRELRGPLLVAGGIEGVGWDEFATVDMEGGERRHGLVLEVDQDLATLQVLESTDGMALDGIRIR